MKDRWPANPGFVWEQDHNTGAISLEQEQPRETYERLYGKPADPDAVWRDRERHADRSAQQ